MDRKKSIDYLEELQGKFYSSNFNKDEVMTHTVDNLNNYYKKIQDFYNEEVKEFLIKEMFNILNQELLTRFEKPLPYFMMKTVENEITLAIKDLFPNNDIEIPVYGTLPTNEFQACAILVEDTNDAIIIFESGLFEFSYLMSKIIAGACTIRENENGGFKYGLSENEIINNLNEKQDLKNKFIDLLLAYFIYQKPCYAKPYFIEPQYNSLVATLTNSFETFVMAHEYGHILCGHLSRSKTCKRILNKVEVDEILFSWIDEIEADLIGASITFQAMRNMGFDTALSFIGIDFFFSSIGLLERGFSFVKTGVEEVQESETHPPSSIRQEFIRQEMLASNIGSEMDGAIQLGESVKFIIENLWEETKYLIFDIYNNISD